MASLASLADSVVAGEIEKVQQQVQELLDEGVKPLDIINEGLIAGMNIVGPRFKAGEMFVPEVLVAAKAMAMGVEIVRPLISDKELFSNGKVVLGTVKGDLHDIGKNLVGMMMESSGLEVIDLGVDVAPEKFVAAVKEHRPDILALSALLTTTMPKLQDTIEAVAAADLREQVKIIVGGAPVTAEYAETIGADGYAPDAASASELCLGLINGR
ncbi:MAG: cobalamin-binding protein [Clostridia bacterium]|nr:cobalamin-binding protein [Clostridia bacterium]